MSSARMTKWKRQALAFLLFIPLVAIGTSKLALAVPILYGGLGGHNNGDSTNDGALVIVGQTTGTTAIIGHPAGVTRISGLDFGLNGVLYGTTLVPGGGFPPPSGPRSSNLITINPDTGALLSSTAITSGGVLLSIADLAVQPLTGTLFGITTPDGVAGGPGLLYTIDANTGVATLVGNAGAFFGSIAFALDGTLYMSAADLDFTNGQTIHQALRTLNPLTGATLTSVATADFFGAFAIRPTDGAIFGGTGDMHQLFIINGTTGAETLIGDTGRTFVGDLAFRSVPEPATLALLSVGIAGLFGWRRRRMPKISIPASESVRSALCSAGSSASQSARSLD